MSNFISLLLKGIGTALALFTVFGMFFDWVYDVHKNGYWYSCCWRWIFHSGAYL